MNIQIRKITEMEEVFKILDLMQNVWKLHDREVVSSFEMKAITEFGIVLGAYDSDVDSSKPIGFIYAFPKFPNIHYSHMMGIDPSYQGKSIGFLLKLKHREFALQAQNPLISAIEWTVDPLLTINANLNFHKLGVVCNEYHENFYGIPTNVGIYPSLPTDRILVRWLIKSSRVEKRINLVQIKKIEESPVDDLLKFLQTISPLKPDELLKPPETPDFTKIKPNEFIILEIPDKFTELSRPNYEWALNWRMKSRSYFQDCFKHGFYLVDFYTFQKSTNFKRHFYVFSQNNMYNE